MPVIRLHYVRHTHVSILAATNVPVKVIQERLGHATLGFTLARYAHVLPRAQAEAAKLFSEAIGD